MRQFAIFIAILTQSTAFVPSVYPVTERVEYKDFELLIAKAVQSLPPKRKKVYLLSREEGLSAWRRVA